MRKLTIKRLQRDESLRDFLYHIRGIVEATDNIAELTTTLNGAYDLDVEVFAETTSLLEVQALHHLGYHVKSLRTPLGRLQREAYARLEGNDKSAPTRTRKRVVKAKAKQPAHPRRVTADATRAKR